MSQLDPREPFLAEEHETELQIMSAFTYVCDVCGCKIDTLHESSVTQFGKFHYHIHCYNQVRHSYGT